MTAHKPFYSGFNTKSGIDENYGIQAGVARRRFQYSGKSALSYSLLPEGIKSLAVEQRPR
jgi:hypothetical protein